MKIIYTPKDNPVDGREEFSADLDDLWVGEVKLLEKVTKSTFQEFGEMLDRGSATHMLALVWIFRRRVNRDLELNDMDEIMRLSELDIQPDDEDVPDDDEPEGVSLAPKESDDPPATETVADPNAA